MLFIVVIIDIGVSAMDIRKEYERWLENAIADADIVEELKTMDEVKIEDQFAGQAG